MKHVKLFEQFINESDSEARDFAAKMAELEERLQKDNRRIWNKFEKSSSEFWKEVDADSWEVAFEKDPNGCMSFQEELESHLKESLEFDKTVNEDKFKMALGDIEDWMPDDMELQDEYYELLGAEDIDGLTSFFDEFADGDVLQQYGIKYQDLKKLAKTAINL